MKRMWLPRATEVSVYSKFHSCDTDFGDGWQVVLPGWVDVEVYPQLEKHCITEHIYKLKRLMGEVV